MIIWTEATTKPIGPERKMLLRVQYKNPIYFRFPEFVIGWWKHGPGCFAFNDIEHANHLVTHWSEINRPEGTKEDT